MGKLALLQSHSGRKNSTAFTVIRVYSDQMSKETIRLADLRENYERAGLAEADVAADPFLQFERWFKDAVESGVTDPNAMTLATANREGEPSARTVLLKGLNDGHFSFFTNYSSRKAQDLEANPRASLVMHWRELERQIIIRGTVSRTSEEESRSYFQSRPRGAQIGAWVSEHQTSAITDRSHLENLEAQLNQKWPEGSEIPLPSFWGGFRVKPDYIEFWQGRPSRLHDRLAFTPEGGDWNITRLSP